MNHISVTLAMPHFILKTLTHKLIENRIQFNIEHTQMNIDINFG